MRIIFLICLILLFQLTSAAPICADDSVTGSFTTGDNIAPSPVTDLSATSTTPYSVTLSWTAPGDDGNIGKATAYDIRYSISPVTTERKWFDSNKVSEGIPAPKPAGSKQTCVVNGLLPSTTYYFALETVDDNSNWSSLSNCASATTLAEHPKTQTPVIQPTQATTNATSLEEEGPIRINIKGKRGVIFLGLLPDGTLARTTIITLYDYHLEMTIEKGTILLDKDGKPISVIILEYIEPYLAPPPGFVFQATYNFQPYCVIEPPIKIKMLYTLQGLPPDVNESSINIAAYNQNQNGWITLPTTRDIFSQFAGTEITYFSLFALLAPESAAIIGPPNITPVTNLNIKNMTLSSSVVVPGDTLIVSVDVVNVGNVSGEFNLPLIFDGKTLDQKTVLLSALQEEKETFTLVLEEEGIHTIGVGTIFKTVTVKRTAVPAAGGFPPLRTTLLWTAIIGLAIVCIVVLFNLWRKSRVVPRRL